MKLTTQRLKQIIKEELQRTLESMYSGGIQKDPIGEFIREAIALGEDNGIWDEDEAVRQYIKNLSEEGWKEYLEVGEDKDKFIKSVLDMLPNYS